MPTIEQASRALDPEQYERVEPKAAFVPPYVPASPGYNPFLRCPLPPVGGSVDSLRQFYRDGIPQARILTGAS